MEDEKTQPTGARKKLFWILLMTLLTIGLSLLLYACTGAPGPSGKDAPWPPGVDRELNLSVTVSKPANGTHFVAGEHRVPAVVATGNATQLLKDGQTVTVDGTAGSVQLVQCFRSAEGARA